MELAKAIEILETELQTAELQTEPDFYNALRLGIEALKLRLKTKDGGWVSPEWRLPGEAEG